MIKRWIVFIIAQCLILAAIGAIAYGHRDKVQIIKKPPREIAQWYKPQNKRQVWLHNMFKLRREMQAVRYYAEREDDLHLTQWLTKLNQHYRKIAEMVPTWNNKLDVSLMDVMKTAANSQDFNLVIAQLDQLTKNCQSCHDDYRSITATMYRAPDFSKIKLANQQSLNQQMIKLSEQVNMIKIAITDGFDTTALSAFNELKLSMSALATGCDSCHSNSKKEFPNTKLKATLAKLEQALQSGTAKEQGQQLGTLAVEACANCHANHRLSFDNRELLVNPRPWAQLIKH
jgi:cytochrome c556